MALFGFSSTDDFAQLMGVSVPSSVTPMLLARWGGEAVAVFRLPAGWAMDRWWNGAWGKSEEDQPQCDPDQIADSLLRTALFQRLASAGIGHVQVEAPMPDGMVHEMERLAAAIMAESGARPLYAATYTTGEWDDVHTARIALYPNPDQAIAHVRGAEIYEQFQDATAGYHDPGQWGVEISVARERLPAHLQAVLDGSLVPPRRPSILCDQDSSWHVEVPDRGRISFTGSASEGAAARFLCSLPLAKPTSRLLVEAEDFPRPEWLDASEGELRWRHSPPEWDPQAIVEGRAVASGLDAADLLKQARSAMSQVVRGTDSEPDDQVVG